MEHGVIANKWLKAGPPGTIDAVFKCWGWSAWVNLVGNIFNIKCYKIKSQDKTSNY